MNSRIKISSLLETLNVVITDLNRFVHFHPYGICVKFLNTLAVTCDFQQCGILTSVDSDKPVQPPVKLRHSKFCSVSSLTVIEYSSDKQRL